MRRLLPLVALAIGVALLVPVAQFVWFVVSNYAVGFGIDFTIWRIALGSACTVLGAAAIVWSVFKLSRKQNL
jgi:hypothetical protein